MEFLILLAVLPGIIISYLIYKADKIEKEPKRELLKAFLLGIGSVFLTLLISYIFGVFSFNIDSNSWSEIFLYSFFGVSLIEEFSKWLCSYLFMKKNKNYNYLFDGIVYAVFVAIGFATIENILYTISGGVATGIIRAITTVPAHTFFGVFCGYYLSMAKREKVLLNKKKQNLYFIYSLLVPFLLHGFYDFCLLTQNMLLFYLYLIFVVILYVVSIYHIKKMMKSDKPFIEKKINFCKDCGNKITGNFCSNCGRKIV